MAERAADQAWRNRNLVETNTRFEPGPGGCYADGNAELRQDLVDSGVFGIGHAWSCFVRGCGGRGARGGRAVSETVTHGTFATLSPQGDA